METQVVPLNTSMALVVVLYMINPSAGFWMPYFSIALIRGGRKPICVDLTSSIAEESGEEPSELTATCDVRIREVKISVRNISSVLLMAKCF